MKRVFTGWLLACSLLLLLVGCEAEKVDYSARLYQKDQLSFQHFGHWTIASDEVADDVRFFSLEGPADIIIAGQVYSAQEQLLMDDFVRWYSEAFAKELPFGKVIDVRFSELVKTVGDTAHSGVREDFVVELLGQHIPFSREYLMLEKNDKVLFLMYQSEDSEYEKGQDSLNLLLKSVQF